MEMVTSPWTGCMYVECSMIHCDSSSHRAGIEDTAESILWKCGETAQEAGPLERARRVNASYG